MVVQTLAAVVVVVVVEVIMVFTDDVPEVEVDVAELLAVVVVRMVVLGTEEELNEVEDATLVSETVESVEVVVAVVVGVEDETEPAEEVAELVGEIVVLAVPVVLPVFVVLAVPTGRLLTVVDNTAEPVDDVGIVVETVELVEDAAAVEMELVTDEDVGEEEEGKLT